MLSNNGLSYKVIGVMFLWLCWVQLAAAQELAPRAYIITPVHGNATTLTWSFYNGGLNLSNTVPITGATGTYSVSTISLYHAFGLFGRSANIAASMPYAIGTFSGDVLGTNKSVYRSGLVDVTARFSVNLLGGPALEAQDFVKWRQKRILGASLKIVAPTGQYSPTKLVNWGINRWAFKPELGYSDRRGHWVLDAYGGVWFYTANPAYYALPEPKPQTQEPIGSLEGHLSYSFKARAWASLDGNFWWGGVTSLESFRNPKTRQTSSRGGVTLSLPFTKHQSVKVAYSHGTYIRFGGDYSSLQVAWQYSWIGKPR
jgi:hypothetical protein